MPVEFDNITYACWKSGLSVGQAISIVQWLAVVEKANNPEYLKAKMEADEYWTSNAPEHEIIFAHNHGLISDAVFDVIGVTRNLNF